MGVVFGLHGLVIDTGRIHEGLAIELSLVHFALLRQQPGQSHGGWHGCYGALPVADLHLLEQEILGNHGAQLLFAHAVAAQPGL